MNREEISIQFIPKPAPSLRYSDLEAFSCSVKLLILVDPHDRKAIISKKILDQLIEFKLIQKTSIMPIGRMKKYQDAIEVKSITEVRHEYTGILIGSFAFSLASFFEWELLKL